MKVDGHTTCSRRSLSRYQGTDALMLLPLPPQIWQLLRLGLATDRSPRHGAGFDLEDLAGVWALTATRQMYHHCMSRGTGNL